jgi:hypothetical protein
MTLLTNSQPAPLHAKRLLPVENHRRLPNAAFLMSDRDRSLGHPQIQETAFR